MKDVVNYWKNTGDALTDRVNRVKTWLCDGSDGQTFTITGGDTLPIDTDAIRARGFAYDWCCLEDTFDEIVGWKHDYKIDDEELDGKAREIVSKLDAFVKDVNEHPEKFFAPIRTADEENRIRQLRMTRLRDQLSDGETLSAKEVVDLFVGHFGATILTEGFAAYCEKQGKVDLDAD